MALLSDLLHVGQVGEDRLQLQRAHVDLAALVAEAVEAARPLRGEVRRWPSRSTYPTSSSAHVDEQRIRQVLDNLLSNAVKYSAARVAR